MSIRLADGGRDFDVRFFSAPCNLIFPARRRMHFRWGRNMTALPFPSSQSAFQRAIAGRSI